MTVTIARLSHEPFTDIVKNGKRIQIEGIQLVYLPKKEQTPCFGCIVSKKVSPLATKRNRIKRLFRVSFRVIYRINPKPIDCVLVIHRIPSPLTLKKTAMIVQSLWDTIHI
jgi:ribonuclease P protein component